MHGANLLQGESFGIESRQTGFFPMSRKKYKEECVCMCICENLPTCSSCYTTAVNTQMHQKFAAFLEECPLPAFWAFFSPVSVFYFDSFVQVHTGS